MADCMSDAFRKRCIIVGGGITGMSAALMLAQSGMAVTLIEKHPRLAPLLRGFSRHGIHFETGFHFAGGLERTGILRAWLKVMKLDLPYNRILPETETVCLAGRRFTMPCGHANILRWTAAHFPASVPGMERFLRELEEKLGASPYTSPFQEQKNSLHVLERPETVTNHLDSLPLAEDLKTILKARCLLYGVPPASAVWAEYALVAGAYFSSSATLEGGGETFCRAWEKALAAHEVDVRCGKAVTDILLSPREGKNAVSGVALEDGECTKADHVLFTGNPAQLARLLPPRACRPAYFRHIASMQDTPAPFVCYGIADDTVPELSCWYKAPQDCRFPLIGENDATLSVMTGPASADGRKSCLAIGLHKAEIGMDGEDSREAICPQNKAALTRALAAEAEAMLPELVGHWRIVDASTAATMRRWLYGSTGSIYGWRHDETTLPLPPVTRVPGLFLAGQNILLPGMLGCIISAAISSDFMLGNSSLADRFRICAKEGL